MQITAPEITASETLLQVAAAVITNKNRNQVFLAKRARSQHQGGLWEFPGGKVDPGEQPEDALIREMQEEVGIRPTRYYPLMSIIHHYPDKSVLLHIWCILGFDGVAVGNEGQTVKWVSVDALSNYSFPEANQPILECIHGGLPIIAWP